MIASQARETAAGGSRPLVRDRLAVLILLAGLALGLLAERLFYGHPLGLGYPLFAALGLATLAALARAAKLPTARGGWLLALPVLGFATAAALRADPQLAVLNVLASLGVLAVLAYAVAGPSWVRLPLIGYPLAATRALVEAGLRPPVLALTGLDLGGSRAADRSRAAPVLRGLLLALPVLLIFTALFASADLVFQREVEALLRLDFLDRLRELANHGFLVLVAAWFVAGGLAFCLRTGWAPGSRLLGLPTTWLAGAGLQSAEADGLRRFGAGLMAEGVLCRPWERPRLGVVEAIVLLAAVDLLFAAFVGIQATYLFGGEANIGQAGFTYAEYARRGFFELVAVALLALGLGLGLLQVTRLVPGRPALTFRLLLSALAGLVLVVLASSAQRLALYEAAYGFTAPRLYSHVFMAVLAGLFIWFVITLWWRPERFAVGAFLALMAFVAALDLVNPDAAIVHQNLARYAATGDLDAEYLLRLSPEAVPPLAAALAELEDPAEVPARRAVEAALAAQARRLARLAPEPLPALNLGRERARAALAAAGIGAEAGSP